MVLRNVRDAKYKCFLLSLRFFICIYNFTLKKQIKCKNANKKGGNSVILYCV